MKNIDKLSNTIFVRDNLEVLRCLDKDSVDLIYLDPPFNSNRNYVAPIGSEAAGAHFKDRWYLSDTKKEWHGELSEKNPKLYEIIHGVGVVNGKRDKAYLIYMAMRLLEIKRILKDTGSIYLHCDSTMSHSLKLVMDAVFKKQNFINEIIWCYDTGGKGKSRFPKKHDAILYYGKSKEFNFYYDQVSLPRDTSTMHETVLKDKNGRLYQRNFKNGKEYKYYLNKGVLPLSWWNDIPALNPASKERTGYPTQKPEALLLRIIKASSNEGDIVLDPFCGCATACVVSEMLNRKWIGVDLSKKAGELVKKRIKKKFQQGELVNKHGKIKKKFNKYLYKKRFAY